MSEKKDCYWYKRKTVGQRGCGVLNCLQCKTNNVCSFYETEPDYTARQERFEEKQNKIIINSGIISFRERMGLNRG